MPDCPLCGTRLRGDHCETCGWLPEAPSATVATPANRPPASVRAVQPMVALPPTTANRLPLFIGAGLAIVIALVVAISVSQPANSRQSAAQQSAATQYPTAVEITAADPATSATSEYPPVYVTEGKECQRIDDGPFGAVGTANATTSCPFAINLYEAYLDSGLDGDPGTVTAYSPVTKKTYDMDCSGEQPVLCTGGVAARVIIYGGELNIEVDE